MAHAADPSIVAVGRMAPVKRFGLLLEAAAEARRRVPDLRLRLIGDGPDARRAASGGSPTTTPAAGSTLPGHLDRDELRDEYRRAWVVASASLAEGWGLTLTEGAACGTPAVATDIRGHRCSVVDGTTGLLADPADLGATLATVLSDDMLRQRLASDALGAGADADLGCLGARGAAGVPPRRDRPSEAARGRH